MAETYTHEEQRLLLRLARDTLEAVTSGKAEPDVNLAQVPPALAEKRACFVTMHRRSDGSLRGCTGTLVARRPLALEVVYTTVQTAFQDWRFFPVTEVEVGDIHLEISVLTPSKPLEFVDSEDLLHKLRPGIDGVTLRLENQRATFLPQVWESYPDPRVFLSLLAQKMGRSSDSWRDPHLEVETYQAIVFEETK
jgi:AmmeMemoRadiSam system protein A